MNWKDYKNNIESLTKEELKKIEEEAEKIIKEQTMRKIGLYLNGLLMKEYPYTNEGYLQALKEAKFTWEETEEFHEIKVIY